MWDFIRYGHENVLVVRVDATQYEGWFYEGAGIYRHVWLNQYDPVHIAEDGLFVHSVVRSLGGGAMAKRPEAEVTVETTVVNERSGTAGADVKSYVMDREGKVLGRGMAQAVHLGPGESKTVVEKIVVQHPVLWSPDQAYLYRAGSVVRSGVRVLDKKRSGWE